MYQYLLRSVLCYPYQQTLRLFALHRNLQVSGSPSYGIEEGQETVLEVIVLEPPFFLALLLDLDSLFERLRLRSCRGK